MWGISLVLLAGAVPLLADEARLSEVRRLIDDGGARQTMSWLLVDRESRWNLLLDEIATGAPDGLRVAADLRSSAADAHAGETLTMAIQEALPRNPAGVLGLVAAQRFSSHDACGMYGFGQMEDERPLATILGLVDTRIEAVSRVRESRLVTARDACLAALRLLRSDLAKQGGR